MLVEPTADLHEGAKELIAGQGDKRGEDLNP